MNMNKKESSITGISYQVAFVKSTFGFALLKLSK